MSITVVALYYRKTRKMLVVGGGGRESLTFYRGLLVWRQTSPCIGLDYKMDQIYTTISFCPINAKFKYVSLLGNWVIFPEFQKD